MSKLFPTQEIGSIKKPADMLKKVKDPKRPLEYFYKGASQEVLIDENVSKDMLVLAICELDLNNHNQKILKKINRIIENEL